MMGPKADNKRGFWESLPISRVNMALMYALGGTWDEPASAPDGWESSPELDRLLERARHALEEAFGDLEPVWAGERTIGWKDPRMSMLLPFWQQLLPIDTVVLCLRDPRVVAGSLKERDGLPAEQSARLWLRYVTGALRDAPTTVVVWYEDFFEDLEAQVDRLRSGLDLPPPSDKVRDEIRAFVDPGLRRAPALEGAGGRWMELAVEVAERLRDDPEARPWWFGEVLERGLRAPGLESRLMQQRDEARRGHEIASQRVASLERTVHRLRERLSEVERELDRRLTPSSGS